MHSLLLKENVLIEEEILTPLTLPKSLNLRFIELSQIGALDIKDKSFKIVSR